MPKVNVVGVGEVSFPESMTQEEIINAIETEIIPKSQAKASTVEPRSPDLKASLFPRSAEAAENGSGAIKKGLAGALDAYSLLGRGVASLPSIKSGNYLNSLADTRGKGIIDQTIRDPATFLTAPIGGAGGAALAAKTLGKVALKGLLPTAAKGAAEGVISASSHLADNKPGEKYGSKQAVLEVAASALLPTSLKAIGQGLGKVAQNQAKNILESVIKPSKQLTQNIGKKFSIQELFDAKLDSPKGLKGIQEKLVENKGRIDKLYDEELGRLKDVSIPITDVFEKTKQGVAELAEKGEVGPEDFAGMEAAGNLWKNYLDNSKFGKKLVEQGNPRDVVELRKLLGKSSVFDRTNPASVKGAEIFAKEMYRNLNKELSTVSPKLRALDAEYSIYHPINKAVEAAGARLAKNSPVSLLDAIALGTGFGAGSVNGGAAEGTLSGLAAFGLTRGVRSPGVASVLYRAGEKMADKTSGEVGSRAVSTLRQLGSQGQRN